MKNKNIIIFAIALICLIVAIVSLDDNLMSPYVSFKEAMEKPDQYVQVIGKTDNSKKITFADGYFSFSMIEDNGDMMDIKFKGAKPLNFEHADQVVVLGKYDGQKQIFMADKLLVKCPSKYKKKVSTR